MKGFILTAFVILLIGKASVDNVSIFKFTDTGNDSTIYVTKGVVRNGAGGESVSVSSCVIPGSLSLALGGTLRVHP